MSRYGRTAPAEGVSHGEHRGTHGEPRKQGNRMNALRATCPGHLSLGSAIVFRRGGASRHKGTRADFVGWRHLIGRLLKRVALTLHARPDRGTNGRRPRDRGNDPPPGSGCVLEADRLGRGSTARRNVGLVFFRCMIALDGRIVSATSACTKQQGGHDQSDMEQFHAPMIGRARSTASPGCSRPLWPTRSARRPIDLLGHDTTQA